MNKKIKNNANSDKNVKSPKHYSLFTMSFRNIWRNKTRSGVILGAITLGLFAGTYLSAFMSGWMVGTVNDEINTNLSHIQIRDTAFSANNDINAYFLRENIDATLRKGTAQHVSYRLNINGMLASANNAVGVRANGVNRTEDMAVSTVWQTIPDTLGEFLPDDARNPIVISAKTAKKLKVKLRSKIVFSFPNTEGEMQAMSFRVCGIFHTANTAFDEGNVFMRYDDIFPATALPQDAVHVAAIMFGNDTPLDKIDELSLEIKAVFLDLDVKSWKEINPLIAMSMGMIDMFAIGIIAIFLLALAFGIINTMLMAVLERTHELGMLRAIGMSRGQVFRMIMLETIFLTLVGSITGVILATLVLLPSIHSGVDLTPLMGNSFEDYGGFSSVVYPVVNFKMFAQILLLVIAAGILSAIYPARKALKIKILEAMRG
ncbi:MAG: ABC transporter permease YtrF [Candidatus Ordinivivax streblomastigis]|uniref:ABC transporter permease YtrF n=1 Tax=Candidatus Ordinivivax streblomastigis TaxID=2540710 RepID=A0A5M8NZV9_9BACT|nr:MAG: ABC transporter permease YtrF [Candidatus Ordinivivax streblomastigis]